MSFPVLCILDCSLRKTLAYEYHCSLQWVLDAPHREGLANKTSERALDLQYFGRSSGLDSVRSPRFGGG